MRVEHFKRVARFREARGSSDTIELEGRRVKRTRGSEVDDLRVRPWKGAIALLGRCDDSRDWLLGAHEFVPVLETNS